MPALTLFGNAVGVQRDMSAQHPSHSVLPQDCAETTKARFSLTKWRCEKDFKTVWNIEVHDPTSCPDFQQAEETVASFVYVGTTSNS